MFVDGAWADAASGARFTASSPATGKAIAEVPEGGREDAQLAIDAANRAAEGWARAGAFERADAMHRIADEVERRRDSLTHTLTLDQGKPLSESRDEVAELVQYWRNAAEGVAEADLPPGVFNFVTGPGAVVGDELARNPGTHGVGFIGSTETGRRVAEAAAGKAAVLELGGNGPVVVLDDADLDLAAEATVTACFMCAGQSCTAGECLLVHSAVREEFVARVAALVTDRVVLGDPFAA